MTIQSYSKEEIDKLYAELKATVTTKYHDDIVHGWHKEVVAKDAEIARLKGIMAGQASLLALHGIDPCTSSK